MKTKLIATLTLSAALMAGAFVAKAELGESKKKTPIVEVIELESHPVLDEVVDCEYAVTPKGMTKISGGDNC